MKKNLRNSLDMKCFVNKVKFLLVSFMEVVFFEQR